MPGSTESACIPALERSSGKTVGDQIGLGYYPVSSAGEYTCKCRHNTCGELCDSCCPMYNQRRWTTSKFISGNECERCQCYGEYF